jgi:hypothetical protein
MHMLTQQNSVHLTRTGPGSVLNYQIFWIIRWYLHWPEFLQVIFCYCSYNWALQLIRAVFHLDIWLSCWFRVIRVLFCAFWSLHSWRSWWTRDKGQEILQQLLYRQYWRPFWTCPWDLPVSMMKLFSGKKQNFRSWGYSLHVPDYQDFQIIRCQIKGILLHLN